MLPRPQILRSFLIPAAGCGIALGFVSCASPVSTGGTVARQNSVPVHLRHRQPGDPASRAENRPVVETTRETFFAWLFSLGGDPPPSLRKAKKPAGPVIPATKVHSGVLARSSRSNTRIIVDIGQQKAFLLVDGSVAIETPISTARPGKYTPRGSFRVSERVRAGKVSTIYGVGMPYWMRLSGSVYGVHAGYLPGYPASAGCIRLPSDAAQLIFDNTRHGTPVSVYSAWSGA